MINIDDQNIITLLGIESLPEERKIELIDNVSGLVEKRLVLRMLNSFDPKKRKDFENLLDAENDEAVNLFVEQNVPDLQAWMVEEITKIKHDLAGLIANIDKEAKA